MMRGRGAPSGQRTRLARVAKTALTLMNGSSHTRNKGHDEYRRAAEGTWLPVFRL
jgi:hypothetical protein